MRGTNVTILTDQKALKTCLDRTQASQTIGHWQEFFASLNHTIVRTAGRENFIPDAISRNYVRIGTSTEEEDCIPESIDNTTLHRAPTLPTPPDTITCNNLSIALVTPYMSEYQSSTNDFSHIHCEYNLCRSCGKATGYHHTCLYQDDDDWKQFVSYPERTEFQEITTPPELQDQQSAPLTPIDPAILKGYTLLAVEQIGVEAYKEDILRMYQHDKQHKREHWTNYNDEYGKTHYSTHPNRTRYLNPNFRTCLVYGT